MVYCIVSLDVLELRTSILHISKTLDSSVMELYRLVQEYEKINCEMKIVSENRYEIYNKQAGYIYGFTKRLEEVLEICEYKDDIDN